MITDLEKAKIIQIYLSGIGFISTKIYDIDQENSYVNLFNKELQITIYFYDDSIEIFSHIAAPSEIFLKLKSNLQKQIKLYMFK